MNINKAAKQLQALFEETNKAVKGNCIAPELADIEKILEDNLQQKGGDAHMPVVGQYTGSIAETFLDRKPEGAAQPKPESWQEIAREAATKIWAECGEHSDYLDTKQMQAIILTAIERSHADDWQDLAAERENSTRLACELSTAKSELATERQRREQAEQEP